MEIWMIEFYENIKKKIWMKISIGLKFMKTYVYDIQ